MYYEIDIIDVRFYFYIIHSLHLLMKTVLYVAIRGNIFIHRIIYFQ